MRYWIYGNLQYSSENTVKVSYISGMKMRENDSTYYGQGSSLGMMMQFGVTAHIAYRWLEKGILNRNGLIQGNMKDSYGRANQSLVSPAFYRKFDKVPKEDLPRYLLDMEALRALLGVKDRSRASTDLWRILVETRLELE